MSPETLRSWRDTVARWRAERDAYAKRAAARRKDAIELRRRRDFLGAMMADSRAREYREVRDRLQAEITATCSRYGIR